MQPILSVSAMRNCDHKTIQNGTDSKVLMYRAGESIFRSRSWEGETAIVTGSGNNAGDGYVLALLLHAAGKSCRLVRLSEKCSPDGAFYFEKCCAAGIPCTTEINFTHTNTIADCILGTGFHGEVRPDLQTVIEKINASSAFVVSVDINSGMNGDTGEGPCCVRSDETISIGFVKYGHLAGMARSLIGTLKNYDIGIGCTEEFTPFYSIKESPEYLPDIPMNQTAFLHAAELISCDIPSETLRDRMMNYAARKQCLLAVYAESSVLLCDGVQCCILETNLPEMMCRQFLKSCPSLHAISSYNIKIRCSRIQFEK